MGVNLGGWLGGELGYGLDNSLFASVQVTPVLHGGLSFGLEDGLTGSIGFNSGNYAYDLEVQVGGWLIVFFGGMQYVNVPQTVLSR